MKGVNAFNARVVTILVLKGDVWQCILHARTTTRWVNVHHVTKVMRFQMECVGHKLRRIQDASVGTKAESVFNVIKGTF